MSPTDHAPAPPSCCGGPASPPLDAEHAAELAAGLKALADPVRLRLVSLVAASPDGEVCACDLTTPVERSQATVSHHLSQLVSAGILRREQRGRWAFFRLDRERLAALAAAISPTDQP